MKPYIAVLYDSLIESVRSRVLWILLAGWSLILLALFPLALSEGETYRIGTGDVTNAGAMMDQLAQASAGRGTRSQRAIFAKLDEDFQSTLKDRERSKRKISIGRLVSTLNQLLEKEDLYDKQAWPTADRRDELKDILETPKKSPDQLQKLNRRLLDLAFPGSIRPATGQATWLTYAGMKFMDPLPFTMRQIRPFIEANLFPFIMWLGLGQIAMMVAIVITAPMIPDMFQTGSLHLLLSKPLSRSLLFLSKYIGGCIFVAMNVAFLIAGLYFYAGMQLGIWNNGILWCIPLFIFAFMVFYSVSAFVGLIWKNPIICVVITALFWGICFTIGVVRNIAEGFLKGPPEIQSILPIGDIPVTANRQGRILFWNADAKAWQVAFGDVNGQRVLGPFWDAKQGNLYFGRTRFVPMGLGGSSSPRLEFARFPEWATAPTQTAATPAEQKRKPWDDIRLDSAPELPLDTTDVIPWDDSLLSITADAAYLFDQESSSKNEQQKISVFGFDVKLPQATESHRKVTDSDWDFRKPLAACRVQNTSELLVVSKGVLTLFEYDGKKFVKRKTLDLDFPAETVANIAICGRTAIVCPEDSVPILVNIDSMSESSEFESLGKVTIKRTAIAQDGRVALLSKSGKLWIVQQTSNATANATANAATDTTTAPSEKLLNISTPNLSGQGFASTMAFDKLGRLWVAHHIKQVDVWDNALTQSTLTFRPAPTTPEFLYDYLINPFYLVNPKPSAIQETIQYILKNPDNKVTAIDRADLDMPTIQRDPWQPIWTNAIFIAVMLSASCWLLYRQDL